MVGTSVLVSLKKDYRRRNTGNGIFFSNLVDLESSSWIQKLKSRNTNVILQRGFNSFPKTTISRFCYCLRSVYVLYKNVYEKNFDVTSCLIRRTRKESKTLWSIKSLKWHDLRDVVPTHIPFTFKIDTNLCTSFFVHFRDDSLFYTNPLFPRHLRTLSSSLRSSI